LIGKTLKSAVANAEHNNGLAPNSLVVKSAIVTEARHLARITQRAKGSASAIKRRSSHITIVLSDEIPLPQPKQKGAGRKPAA
jgi:large subunit ribosomal protein L22